MKTTKTKNKSRTVKVSMEGKWKYKETYGYGTSEGELFLEQEDNKLSGKIIFTDKPDDAKPYMIQEFLIGRIEELKVWLYAREYDIIHSDERIAYELDNWFGILVDEDTIKGISQDNQGIEGSFQFERIKSHE